MRWCIQPGPSRLFGHDRGCTAFEQRLLRFDGPSGELSSADDDEVLYVLAGEGRAAFGGDTVALGPGTAAYVPRGTGWRVVAAESLEVLSVLVRDPLPPNGATAAVLDVADVDVAGATAGRQFRLLATPEIGCASVTQFVGYIPVGRAPDHFHTYEEVMYVLAGEGALHMGAETAPLVPGAAVHFPARMIHCVENFGPGEMQVLGVFRPAGSPAEAYYPDGTPAMVAVAG
jgi:mannose-6-phosphate isomerase-like protein (cupin superfamily)